MKIKSSSRDKKCTLLKKREVIMNEVSIFMRDYCCSCFHLNTDRAGFDSRAAEERRRVSLHFYSGERSEHYIYRVKGKRVNKEQAVIKFQVLHVRWKLWLLPLEGKCTDVSVEEMSDLVLERGLYIHAGIDNTRTQLFCAAQSAVGQGNVTIRVKSDHDSPVVSH